MLAEKRNYLGVKLIVEANATKARRVVRRVPLALHSV